MNSCRIEQQSDFFKVLGVINFDTVVLLCKQGLALLFEREALAFDFAGVSQADSSAIALLLSWIRYAKVEKKVLSFHNLPTQLLEIANVCEVTPFLNDHIKTKPKNERHG